MFDRIAVGFHPFRSAIKAIKVLANHPIQNILHRLRLPTHHLAGESASGRIADRR